MVKFLKCHRAEVVQRGMFRVEITASRKTGEKKKMIVQGSSGKMIDACAQILPDRYNHNSELTTTVTEIGSNRFQFTLHSKCFLSRHGFSI